MHSFEDRRSESPTRPKFLSQPADTHFSFLLVKMQRAVRARVRHPLIHARPAQSLVSRPEVAMRYRASEVG